MSDVTSPGRGNHEIVTGSEKRPLFSRKSTVSKLTNRSTTTHEVKCNEQEASTERKSKDQTITRRDIFAHSRRGQVGLCECLRPGGEDHLKKNKLTGRLPEKEKVARPIVWDHQGGMAYFKMPLLEWRRVSLPRAQMGDSTGSALIEPSKKRGGGAKVVDEEKGGINQIVQERIEI